jgi:hypothetical protein
MVDFQIGVKYQLTPQLVLDSALGRSLLSSGTAIQGTVGLTWILNTASPALYWQCFRRKRVNMFNRDLPTTTGR